MADQPRTAGSYSYGGNPYPCGTTYETNTSMNPPSRQTVKFITAATIGITLLLLSGLILTGTVISLIIATPLLVIFSPILVPTAFVLFLVASGFFFSGGCGVAAIAALSWIYNYVSGNQPAGSNSLDHAKGYVDDKAREVKERAKDYGNYAQGLGDSITDVKPSDSGHTRTSADKVLTCISRDSVTGAKPSGSGHTRTSADKVSTCISEDSVTDAKPSDSRHTGTSADKVSTNKYWNYAVIAGTIIVFGALRWYEYVRLNDTNVNNRHLVNEVEASKSEWPRKKRQASQENNTFSKFKNIFTFSRK
ncbi:Oleosin 16 kDa, partial [Mucuna pruriens]